VKAQAQITSELATTLVGEGGLFSGDVVAVPGMTSQASCNLMATMMNENVANLKVAKTRAPPNTQTPAGTPGGTGTAKVTTALTNEEKLSELRDMLKAQGEKARWFSNCLEPFDVAKDMSKNMLQHSRFMESAFSRLNEAQARQKLTPAQVTSFEDVCKPHFSWFLKRDALARKMEIELCPARVKAKTAKAQNKPAVASDGSDSQRSQKPQTLV
jgi:hypothetical protein